MISYIASSICFCCNPEVIDNVMMNREEKRYNIIKDGR